MDAFEIGILLLILTCLGIIIYNEYSVDFQEYTDKVIYKEYNPHMHGKIRQCYTIYTKDGYRFDVPKEYYNTITVDSPVRILKNKTMNIVQLNTTSYGELRECT